MIDARHTKGPFTVERIEDGQYAISAPGWFQLATVHHVPLPLDAPDREAMEAQSAGNAALFGAAGDLLEALWEISQRVAREGGDTAKADAAIIRALRLPST